MTKQWNKYREIIVAEYKDQNKPLHEVQRIMLEKYGFWASYVWLSPWRSPSSDRRRWLRLAASDHLSSATRFYP